MRGPSSPAMRANRVWPMAFALILFLLAAPVARAQTAKLPSPDKIVGEYVKAVGGKKRLAALRDATYEWTVRRKDVEAGTARTYLKSPGALRTDLMLAEGETDSAANARTAWTRSTDGHMHTLTDSEAFAARLQATLEASWFVDYKKQKVLARTVALEDVGGEQAYLIELTTRAGARLRYWFSSKSKVVLGMWDEARRMQVRFADWRAQPGSPLQIEPHRLDIGYGDADDITLILKDASYNRGLADSLFEPPSDSTLDIAALLRDLSKNQEEDDKRVGDYTFTQKVTERELNDRGEVKKEKVAVYEVYPVPGSNWVSKLVSENGVPLTPERAEKEQKRVEEELEKSLRDAPKYKEKREREKAKRAEKMKKERAKNGEAADGDADDVDISAFLRACELFSPRRERLRERDVIVFDFRPRAGFRPTNQGETIISKLSGVIWVDPLERQVVRLEARLVEDFKIGGGLLASIKPGSAFIFEQTRLEDGVWLPRFSQVNASARVLVFKGMSINQTREFSDYKRFSANTGDEKLDAPQEKP